MAEFFSLDQAMQSRYLRTSRLLAAEEPIRINDSVSILPISDEQARTIAEVIQKKNLFARHSWEPHFYVTRALELAGRTAIEIFAPGDPKSIAEAAAIQATLVEQLLILASTFSLDRRGLQKKLAVSIKPSDEIEFIIGPKFYSIRSQKRGVVRTRPGLLVNRRLAKTFNSLEFAKLLKHSKRPEIEARVVASLGWLFQSRTEVDLAAAVVKTAIACETLLVFSESESLAQTLSERIAFIVGRTPSERQVLSRTIKRFYEVRSGVVHGSKRKRKHLSYEMLELVDRLVLAAALTIRNTRNSWVTSEEVRLWCEDQRWGKNTFSQQLSVPNRFLNRMCKEAIKLCGDV
jgi:hypothetical protein